MLERAIKQKWEIDPRAFSALPNAMLTIALDAKKEDRSRIAAARVVATMHGQNLDGEKPSELHLHQHGDTNQTIVGDFSGLTNDQLRTYIELCEQIERGGAAAIAIAGQDKRSAETIVQE